VEKQGVYIYVSASKGSICFQKTCWNKTKQHRPPNTFFSGEFEASGMAAGGGATVSELQNSTKLKKIYTSQILSPSSIQIRKQNFQ
jgi:hypothetical protein